MVQRVKNFVEELKILSGGWRLILELGNPSCWSGKNV
jgi:hypothetical protein